MELNPSIITAIKENILTDQYFMNHYKVERLGILHWNEDTDNTVRLFLDCGALAGNMDLFDFVEISDYILDKTGYELEVVTNNIIEENPDKGPRVMEWVMMLYDKK